MPPLPLVGNVAKHEDFFGREKVLLRLWRQLESDHVLLLAPRRVGKTSILFRLREQADAHGFRAEYHSVGAVQDEEGFVQALYTTGTRYLLLIDELPLFVSALVRRGEVERAHLPGVVQGSAAAAGQRALAARGLRGSGQLGGGMAAQRDDQ